MMSTASGTKHYNTTDLDPVTTFERHVFHRDQFAHYLRWSHILKEAKIGDRIVDFGCGKGNLAELLYRNRFAPSIYYGFDVRKQTIEKAAAHFAMVRWAKWYTCDLVKASPEMFSNMRLEGDKVCSFEVLEHIGKQNADRYLENFKSCGSVDATYYLSTPNYDPNVGAAGNHTYDSGDDRGYSPQEFGHGELKEILERHFQIIHKYGTFASIRDYAPFMNDHQRWIFDQLREYYDTNVMAVIMAPFFPEKARNCMWVMRRKNEEKG